LSLIADSLKKANKARSERRVFPHVRNPLALKKTTRGLGLPTIAKITFLVALPGMILIYLVQSGVFSGKQIFTNDRPLSKVSESTQETFNSESESLHTALQNQNQVTSPPLVEKNSRATKPVTPTVETKRPQPTIPRIVQSPAPDSKQIIAEKIEAKAVIPQEEIAPPEIFPPSQVAEVKPVELATEEIVAPAAPTEPVMMAEAAPAEPISPVPGREIGEEKSPANLAEESPLAVMPANTKLKEVKEIIETLGPTFPVKMAQGRDPSPVSAAEKKQPVELKSPAKILTAEKPVIEEKHVEAKVDLEKPKAVQETIDVSKVTEKKEPASDELPLQVTSRQFDQGGDTFISSGYYFNRAVFFQQAKDWEQSLKNYQMAAELDQNNADIYNNMGVVNKEMRRFDQAIEELLRAVYLNPDYAKAYNNLGVVYYLKKQFDSAIRNYRKAIDLDQKNLEAFNNLAIIHKKKNEMNQAKSVLNQALAMNAKHAGTNYNLAVLHEELDEVPQAIYYYQRFVQFGRESHPALVFTVQDHLADLTR
jgi:Tfp pilus assembly protein PilF